MFLLPQSWLGVSPSRPHPTTTEASCQVTLLTPSNGKLNTHNVFRDKLAEIDARLRRLEEESSNPLKSSPGSGSGTQKSHHSSIHITPLGENPSLVSQEWDSFEALGNFIPSGPNGSDGNVSVLSNLPDGHSTVAVPFPAVEIPPESLAPLPEDGPQGWDPQEFSGESRPSVRRFRGDATPWNVLIDGTAMSTLADGPFNETIMRLAEEESSTRPAVGNIHFDFLKEFSPITKDLVLEYANQYASEAPFQVVYCTDMRQIIERGLTTKRWTHWREVVSVLLVRLASIFFEHVVNRRTDEIMVTLSVCRLWIGSPEGRDARMRL